MMVKGLVSLTLCLTFLAWAQIDGGVKVEVDEFTGERICSHFAVVSSTDFTGIRLGVEGRKLIMLISRGNADAPAFNRFGAVPDDRVFIRWPDGTVAQYPVEENAYEFEMDLEIAAIDASADIYAILASPGDLRVRFDGSRGRFDFTIPHSILVALANGFGKECMD